MLNINTKFLAIVLSFMVCVGAGGYQLGRYHHTCEVPSETASPPSAQADSYQLNMSAVRDGSSSFFSEEELGDHFKGKLSYYGVTDVSVNINGETIPLETALKNRQITSEELFQLARADAAIGNCTEFYTSNLGLSRFFYSYPGFELMLTYDVLETASGERQLVNEVAVCSWNYHKNAEKDLLRSKITSPDSIYREDWGITFEVEGASPTRIELSCTQEDGQQIGELRVFDYSIWSNAVGGVEAKSDPSEFIPFVISRNSKSEHTVDLSQKYDALPTGSYQLILYIEDIYDGSQVHPLTKNYTDKQEFLIHFDIP